MANKTELTQAEQYQAAKAAFFSADDLSAEEIMHTLWKRGYCPSKYWNRLDRPIVFPDGSAFDEVSGEAFEDYCDVLHKNVGLDDETLAELHEVQTFLGLPLAQAARP